MDATGEYQTTYSDENLNINEVKMIVVGNKVDDAANRQVEFDKAKADYKDRFDIDCFETSAKTGFGIQESIMHLVESTLQDYRRHLPHEQ
jgi:GTPase SAR1 family protein